MPDIGRASCRSGFARHRSASDRRLRFDQGGRVDRGGGLADFRYVEALIKAREACDLVCHIKRNRPEAANG